MMTAAKIKEPGVGIDHNRAWAVFISMTLLLVKVSHAMLLVRTKHDVYVDLVQVVFRRKTGLGTQEMSARNAGRCSTVERDLIGA